MTIAGALTSVEKKFTKKDSKPFAVVVLEDLTGSLEVMIWNETFNEVRRAPRCRATSSPSPAASTSARKARASRRTT